ncbi:MAG: penicillin-binding protein 2 [Bacteroidales bacterium]|nr:penicillin-binding protein 2 [Bacteroidales bacterium]
MKNPYSNRKYIIKGVFLLVGLVFVIKLFFIQIIDKTYILSAQNNVIRLIYQFPARGLIFDRHDKLMVYNEAVYDLMVIPNRMQDIDTLELCELIGIDKETFVGQIEKIKHYSVRKASVFQKQISKETTAYLEEKLFKFPGFYVQPRTLRKYPLPVAAHTVGYVGEANRQLLEKDCYYKSGDYVGISGLEKTYEQVLRGRKGIKRVLVDVFNREKGSFQDGKYDTAMIKGVNLKITLDAELQEYGELLMTNKKGSIIALEPSTGEILALVSSPHYDPNLLVGRVRGKNYKKLQHDPLEPLFNRPLTATYPPGSVFKLVNSLIALQENVVTQHTKYSCEGPETRPIKCSHYHKSPLNMIEAIEVSCNPYFWKTFTAIMKNEDDIHDSFEKWRNHTLSFGFGSKFNSDLFSEVSGFIPEPGYFDKYFGEKGWRPMTIRSLSIGQGEILVTPLQLANLSAIIANRGYYYVPHLVKSIDNHKTEKNNREKNHTTIKPNYFDVIIEGMYQVFEGEEGTARWYKLDNIAVCGKTGTAENPHGKDHSVFIAFAPKDDPQIAIAVVVENSGFGATWAAPISTLMIEKYLTGTVKKKWVEEQMINVILISDN